MCMRKYVYMYIYIYIYVHPKSLVMQSEYTTYDLKVLTYLIRLNVRAARLYGLDMSALLTAFRLCGSAYRWLSKLWSPFGYPTY